MKEVEWAMHQEAVKKFAKYLQVQNADLPEEWCKMFQVQPGNTEVPVDKSKIC